MKRGAGILVAGVLAVLLAGPPAAAQYTTTLVTKTTNGQIENTFAVGEQFILEGTNWPPDTDLQVTFSQSPFSVLGTVRTRSDGSFDRLFRIPTDAREGNATLRVSGGGFQQQHQLRITGFAADDEPRATPRPADPAERRPLQEQVQRQEQFQEQVQVQETRRLGDRLPKTGQDMVLYGGSGILLLLIGGWLLWYANRRGRGEVEVEPGEPVAWTPEDEASLNAYAADLAAQPATVAAGPAPVTDDATHEHLVEADILLVGTR